MYEENGGEIFLPSLLVNSSAILLMKTLIQFKTLIAYGEIFYSKLRCSGNVSAISKS